MEHDVPTELAGAIEQTDFVRRSPSFWGGRRGHKEWLHFVVLGADYDVLVNFSFSDDLRAPHDGRSEVARLTVLVRDGDAWDGDVETFAADDVVVRGGGIEVRFGDNVLAFRDGCYRVRVGLRERPFATDVVFRPRTMPARAPNIPMMDGPPLHWLIVPRCRADGTATLGARDVAFTDALAYHDHNWGRFRWGQDFSWRWSFALPEEPTVPWTVAFASLTDRGRNHACSQGLFLWREHKRWRTFRDHEMRLTSSLGFMRPRAVFKIPRVMALLSPETTTEVPAVVELAADGGGDWFRYRFEAEAVGQVLIPNDTDLGVTVLNEVTGRSWFRGVVAGEAFDVASRSIFELLGA